MGVQLGDIHMIKVLVQKDAREFSTEEAGRKINYESYKAMMVEKADLVIEYSLKIKAWMRDIEEYDKDMKKKTKLSILDKLHPEEINEEENKVIPDEVQVGPGDAIPLTPGYPPVPEDKEPELPAQGEGDNTTVGQGPIPGSDGRPEPGINDGSVL